MPKKIESTGLPRVPLNQYDDTKGGGVPKKKGSSEGSCPFDLPPGWKAVGCVLAGGYGK